MLITIPTWGQDAGPHGVLGGGEAAVFVLACGIELQLQVICPRSDSVWAVEAESVTPPVKLHEYLELML